MKKIRKAKAAEPIVWHVGVITPSEALDPVGLAQLAVIMDVHELKLVGEFLTPRPTLVDELLAMVEEATRSLPARRFPQRIEVVGEDLAQAISQHFGFANTSVLAIASSPLLDMLAASLAESVEEPLSEGVLLGLAHGREEAVAHCEAIVRRHPWEALFSNDLLHLKVEPEPLRFPYVSFLGAMGEGAGVNFFSSLEDARRFESLCREAAERELAEDELFSVVNLTVWFREEDVLDEMEAEAMRRQNLVIDDAFFLHFSLVDAGGDLHIREEAHAREALRHLQALRVAMDAIPADEAADFASWRCQAGLPEGARVSMSPEAGALEAFQADQRLEAQFEAALARPMQKIYRLQARIEGLGHEVARVLEVPDNLTLGGLHLALEYVMGWTTQGLRWEFARDKIRYALPAGDDPESSPLHTSLGDVLGARAKKLTYRLGGKNGWTATLTVLGRSEPEGETLYPRLMEGMGAAVPATAEGASAYGAMLDALEPGQFDPSRYEPLDQALPPVGHLNEEIVTRLLADLDFGDDA